VIFCQCGQRCKQGESNWFSTDSGERESRHFREEPETSLSYIPFTRSSKHRAIRAHVVHVYFERICSCLLDDCSTFAWSCKRGINQHLILHLDIYVFFCTQHCRHVRNFYWSKVFNLLKFDHTSKKKKERREEEITQRWRGRRSRRSTSGVEQRSTWPAGWVA